MSGSSKSNRRRLIVMFALTFGFFLVELIVGYLTGSTALVADSFHMLSDVAALVVSFVSILITPRKWSQNTYGFARAEVLGALVNAVFLVALCFSILMEAIQRFFNPEDINNRLLILIIGILGLVVNVIGLCLFSHSHGGHGHSHGGGGVCDHADEPRRLSSRSSRMSQMLTESFYEARSGESASRNSRHSSMGTCPSSFKGHGHAHAHLQRAGGSQMNIRGLFLHIMADALGSVIVILSALILEYVPWEGVLYVDPALSVLMVSLILASAWPLLKESALILLQTVPADIDVGELTDKLVNHVPGIVQVHNFHVWQLSGDIVVATAHIRCESVNDYTRIVEQVKRIFCKHGIHSITLQPEFPQMVEGVPLMPIKDVNKELPMEL